MLEIPNGYTRGRPCLIRLAVLAGLLLSGPLVRADTEKEALTAMQESLAALCRDSRLGSARVGVLAVLLGLFTLAAGITVAALALAGFAAATASAPFMPGRKAPWESLWTGLYIGCPLTLRSARKGTPRGANRWRARRRSRG